LHVPSEVPWLIASLRSRGPLRAGFNQVAWPAFAVLVVTGAWKIAAVRGQITGSYRTTPIVKLVGWRYPG
jgi:hypothetical protein